MQTIGGDYGSQAIGAVLLALVGVGLIGYGVWFIIQNFTTLIEIGLSPIEVGKTGEQIWVFSPGVYRYISHVLAALGGSSLPPTWRLFLWPGTGCDAGRVGRGGE